MNTPKSFRWPWQRKSPEVLELTETAEERAEREENLMLLSYTKIDVETEDQFKDKLHELVQEGIDFYRRFGRYPNLFQNEGDFLSVMIGKSIGDPAMIVHGTHLRVYKVDFDSHTITYTKVGGITQTEGEQETILV